MESEVLAMSGMDYLVLLGVMAAAMLYLAYFAYGSFKRFRFMDGTATSKIRSAAQGHVELKGLGGWMPNDSIHSPFSKARCVWYHCTIEKRKRSGKRTTWTNISDDCSSHLFQLVDDTGICIVDPDDAHVIPESDMTWYGHNPEYRNQAPKKFGWISFGFGSYRFQERLIRPATEIYTLGWFRTVHSNPSEAFISKQVDDLVKHWKIQPERYLQQFDLDKNGKIQKDEWKVIRAAARKQVLAKINAENGEHHVLSRPEDSRQPYILSAIPEEELVAHKKVKAYGSVAAGLLLFSALVVMFAIRTPFSV